MKTKGKGKAKENGKGKGKAKGKVKGNGKSKVGIPNKQMEVEGSCEWSGLLDDVKRVDHVTLWWIICLRH